ncbi:hypothetical protein [Cupriavidus basilensis]|uniref:hypothetical protein n=1 Tax=Cupriavidus basilensis TaxID=68895 RepID=UPI00130EBE71|nr:hypothetical protein [Cupriavidus basilensis]
MQEQEQELDMDANFPPRRSRATRLSSWRGWTPRQMLEMRQKRPIFRDTRTEPAKEPQ